jgi:hypothetical protein
MDGLPPGAAAVSDFAFRVDAATSKSAAWRPLALQTKPASFAPVGPVGKAKAKAFDKAGASATTDLREGRYWPKSSAACGTPGPPAPQCMRVQVLRRLVR